MPEFPLNAEAILRKIAARVPLRAERQPHRLGGTGGRVACDSLTFGELLSPNLMHIPTCPTEKTLSAHDMQRVAFSLQPVHRQLDELLLLIEPVGGDERLHRGIAVEAALGDEELVGLLLQDVLHPVLCRVEGPVQRHAV